MKIFTLKNLTEKAGEFDKLPWEFAFPADSIPEDVRKDKNKRQAWCTNPSIQHCFYSGMVGIAELSRINKDNPPKEIWLFVADYDCQISDERIREVIAQMKIKPTYIETSIGGNRRLVWVLSIPILVLSNDFGVFVQQQAEKWLRLGLLPMLDVPAFHSTTRLYCCGDKWEPTGHGPIPAEVVQTFFCDCGKEFRFKSNDEVLLPLDIAEKEFKIRYPEFLKWPGEFVVGAQGPSFWVKDSESTMSAIVKPDGMFTFAGHADKPFYSWGDLLGHDFLKEFRTSSIARATTDIWYDGNKYHRKLDGTYISIKKEEFTNYLTVDCSMSTKPDSTGNSPVAQALAHIHSMQRVIGAAPHIPLPAGPIIFQKRRCLNTYDGKPCQPAAGSQKWGPHGEYPFLSAFVDTFFFPYHQLPQWKGWAQYFYKSMIEQVCCPGQAIIMQGEQDCGKSFLTRSVLAPLVGGFCDAASYVLGGNAFNSELFQFPLWALDDDTPSTSSYTSGTAHTLLKKLVANEVFMCHQKYEVPTPVQFGGRVAGSINFDEISCRMLPPSDDAIMDKISLFRCATRAEKPDFIFPSRIETIKLVTKELPYFARGLLDWKAPDEVIPHNRYGVKSFHEESMLAKAKQSGAAAPFKEILLEALFEYFRQHPEEKEVTGSSNQIMQLISGDVRNQGVIQSFKPERVNMNLENLSREKFLGCVPTTQPHTGIRLWTFQKPTAPTA